MTGQICGGPVQYHDVFVINIMSPNLFRVFGPKEDMFEAQYFWTF